MSLPYKNPCGFWCDYGLFIRSFAISCLVLPWRKLVKPLVHMRRFRVDKWSPQPGKLERISCSRVVSSGGGGEAWNQGGAQEVSTELATVHSLNRKMAGLGRRLRVKRLVTKPDRWPRLLSGRHVVDREKVSSTNVSWPSDMCCAHTHLIKIVKTCILLWLEWSIFPVGSCLNTWTQLVTF